VNICPAIARSRTASGQPAKRTALVADLRRVVAAQLAPEEGAVLDVCEWGRLLLYSTQRGGVHALDHRAGADAWVLPATARQVGMAAAFAVPILVESRRSAMTPSSSLLCPGLYIRPGLLLCGTDSSEDEPSGHLKHTLTLCV